MWGVWILALLLGYVASAISTAALQLQQDGFEAHLESHSPVLVNFCIVSDASMPPPSDDSLTEHFIFQSPNSHEPCEKLEPEFETAAEILKGKGITSISIDCSVEAKLCSNYTITSYPAIRIFRGIGNFTRYRHKREASDIISYLIRQSLPLVSEVTSENFKELLLMGTSTLIAYVDEDDQESRAAFISFAESHQNRFIFGISSDVTLAKSDISHTPSIILYNPLDQLNALFQERFDVTKIEDFTKKYSTPLMGTFSLETYYAYTEEGTPLAHIFVRTVEERSTLAVLLKNIAEKYKGKLNFATIDATKYGFFAKALNLIPEQFPAFVIEDLITGDTAPFDQKEEITAEKIEQFVEKYFRNKLNVQTIHQAPMTKAPNRDEL